ncbi:MAG: restriction endonuclease subunit S [Verrucomicrobiae bacterium]|nr:restriction endonuclease subunit S [Verrucomicrobiae bacterium]
MKYPAYPRYKPSGVEWLGEVPEHWEVKRLKYSATINDEILPETTSPDFEFKYVDISSVNGVNGITSTEQLVFENAPSRARRKVRHGDTIISTVRTYLRAIAPIKDSPQNLIVSTGFAVLRPRKLDSSFLAYALRESSFVESVVSRSVGVSYPAVNASEIGGIHIPHPPLPEQTTIAAFLDRETGRIDRLVAKKRELIERLKEKRTALISRAVTRGLPPAAAAKAGLPANPALKPSGVDWLGDIPEHWEVRKFSREVAIAEGQVNPEKEPYASMLLIGPEHVESNTGNLLQRATAAEQSAESGKYFSRKGDVIYSKIRPALRKLVIAPEDCLCSADMYPLRARKKLVNRFIFWFFLSEQFSGWSILESDRVAMPKINRDTLNELRILVPPLPEQAAIAAYLDAETAKLDALAAKIEEAVDRLKEYRTALITTAVTGKIDVRKECHA